MSLLWLPLVGVFVVAPACYAASCAWWPHGKCWCCGGAGRHFRGDGRVFRDCRVCRGSGRRLRMGRRVWNKRKGK